MCGEFLGKLSSWKTFQVERADRLGGSRERCFADGKDSNEVDQPGLHCQASKSDLAGTRCMSCTTASCTSSQACSAT